MFLRTNRVLKFLALILFTFELIASVCAVGIASEGNAIDKIQISNAVQHQNFNIPFLLEELTENEEEKDGHKATYVSISCVLLGLRHLSFDIHRADLSSYFNIFQQGSSSPALFQVHCKLLI